MILPLELQAITKPVVTGLLISVAAGIPLAALTGAILKVTGRQNSTTRFAVWYATLLTISMLPLAGALRLKAAASATLGTSHALITVPSSWSVAGFGVWSFLAVVGLLRIAIGLARVRRLHRICTNVETARLDPILQETLGELNPGRHTQLCTSDELRVPTAVGFFKPRVILPSWVLKELSPAQIRPLLLHELAHVRRWDDWTNLVQKLLHAVFFFHPAVWWVEKRISLEREMACDDVVLAHTENPRAYADCLLSVAEKSFFRKGFSLAQAAVSRMWQTSARISKILDAKRPGILGIWNAASFLLVVPSILSFAVLAHVGSLIAFQDQKPAAVAVGHLVSTKPAQTFVQAAVAKPALLPTVSNVSSARPRRTFSRAGNEAQAMVDSRLIEARLARNRGPANWHGKNTAVAGQLLTTQTVFVVMHSTLNGGPQEFWSVQVWQLTVFRTHAAPIDSLPLRKT